MDRRRFLANTAALAGTAMLPGTGCAEAPLLTVASRQIEVKRRAARVFGVAGPGGKSGLFANEGDVLRGPLLNATVDPLVMHWHGQIFAPADQDRARTGGGALAAGTSDLHDFRLTPGTHWMHSHTLNEQLLLAAPLVTREKDAGDVQDVVVMLHDFSFRSPEELLAGLGGTNVHSAHGGAAAAGPGNHGGMNHGAMNHGSGAVHANDIAYDAFLANDRTLDDPEVVQVERSGR
ncbi:MAG: copper oxidase, partial [Proteobacteria bacterium]|nr:copper oxidase [Pseudomonadota bacterium]